MHYDDEWYEDDPEPTPEYIERRKLDKLFHDIAEISQNGCIGEWLSPDERFELQEYLINHPLNQQPSFC